jgi:hypothetical protein
VGILNSANFCKFSKLRAFQSEWKYGLDSLGERLATLLLLVLGYAGFYDLFHKAGGKWLVSREANGAF